MSSLLFAPCTIGPVALKNRWAMAPMTRGRCPDALPDATVAEYYRRRAAGGVGLIISEGILIDHPLANAYGPTVPAYRPGAADAWRAVVAAVHAHDTRMFAQVWHCGPVAKPGLDASTATTADRAALMDSYARAVDATVRAGFDGLELHGAHGYLLDSFLRTGQSAFVADVVRQARRLAGPRYPIVLRFSSWRVNDYQANYFRDPEHLGSILAELRDAGVDWFHASTRRFWEPAFPDRDPHLNLAGWARRLAGVPVITVGGIGLEPEAYAGDGPASLAALGRRAAAGEFDLVALGRVLMGDPEWIAKSAAGRFRDLIPFPGDAEARAIYP